MENCHECKRFLSFLSVGSHFGLPINVSRYLFCFDESHNHTVLYCVNNLKSIGYFINAKNVQMSDIYFLWKKDNPLIKTIILSMKNSICDLMIKEEDVHTNEYFEETQEKKLISFVYTINECLKKDGATKFISDVFKSHSRYTPGYYFESGTKEFKYKYNSE